MNVISAALLSMAASWQCRNKLKSCPGIAGPEWLEMIRRPGTAWVAVYFFAAFFFFGFTFHSP